MLPQEKCSAMLFFLAEAKKFLNDPHILIYFMIKKQNILKQNKRFFSSSVDDV